MNIPPEALFPRLERLIENKGSLCVVKSNGSGMGLYWSASVGGNWPFCAGGTLEQALDQLVFRHAQLEREALQAQINAIDASANL